MTNETANKEDSQETRRSSWGKVGVFFSVFATIVFVCAFAYGYFELSKVNISLAKMIDDSQQRNESDLGGMQKSVADLQERMQKSQDLFAQQEQLISDWRTTQKGDLNRWYVAEAQYLVKLANDHAQFTHNIKMSMILLQRADQVLQGVQDASLLEIRQSLASDIASLQAAPHVDETALYLWIMALNKQLDELPLPTSPLKPDTKQALSAAVPTNLPWWQAGLAHTWQVLRHVVVVRYNNSNALPLVLPEEKTFLYQNLHAQMESAMWGVLHHKPEVYQASLESAVSWIHKYFDQDATATKNMLQNMAELRKVNIQPPAINFSATLQLFDHYLAQAEQTRPAQ